MKKNLIITLALGLFLISCQNNNTGSEGKTRKTVTTKDLSAQVIEPAVACTSYSIFNPHGPMGATVLYSYTDCNGNPQEGSVEPRETVNVLAEQGSVKCPGGVVTESGSGTTSPTADPVKSKQ